MPFEKKTFDFALQTLKWIDLIDKCQTEVNLIIEFKFYKNK